MPVSFQPAKHQAKPFPAQPQSNKEPLAARVLREACPDQSSKCAEIFQSSFNQQADSSLEVVSCRNGFVNTVIAAYCEHRALVIRPDDVWLAIIAQFSFFVNGNAEVLRKQFVDHEGKKTLTIVASGTRYTVDFGSISRQMTKVIEENIVDPVLREWIIPDFSTTTITDKTVSSVIMMATMKVNSYLSVMMKIVNMLPIGIL